MEDLFTEAIAWYNLPLTVLLGLVVLYWGTVCLGLLDLDEWDFDFGSDGDVDVDLAGTAASGSADMDADVEAPSALMGIGMLRFFHLGKVPMMILLSILFLSMWVISILAHHYLNPMDSLLVSIGIYAGNFFVSLFVMKFLSWPFVPLFAALNRDDEGQEPVVGRSGVVKTAEVTRDFGQIEVPTSSAPLLLQARVQGEEEAAIQKGSEVIIYDYHKETDLYFVRQLKNEA